MRVALVTTTLSTPTVLELYRQHGPDVAFFVAGDKGGDHAGIEALLHSIGGEALYIPPDMQMRWKCSELIGWNSIQRRNIALLEAVKWGADIIVSCDDDNIPLGPGPYFQWFKRALNVRGALETTGSMGALRETTVQGSFSGIKVSGLNGWFDVGKALDPVSSHRGFPVGHRNDLWRCDPVVGAKVGVAAGICLGDPDIGATTRIERAPEVHRVSELLNAGIVVDPSTWTVFNSQNTAFIRELAPAFFMLPFTGRYDDIYASLIMQRVMREKNLHVHFGKPFVWQQRNQHNLIKDLRGEIDGMEAIEELGNWLAQHKFETLDTSVLAQVREIYSILNRSWGRIPQETCIAALAFLDDIESVL
jgi:hypothetical protein